MSLGQILKTYCVIENKMFLFVFLKKDHVYASKKDEKDCWVLGDFLLINMALLLKKKKFGHSGSSI